MSDNKDMFGDSESGRGHPNEDRKLLQQLLSDLFDGVLDSEQLNLLSSMLEESRDARREYVELANLHAGLGYAAESLSHREEVIVDGEHCSDDRADSSSADRSAPLKTVLGRLRQGATRWSGLHPGLAASLLIVFAAGAYFVLARSQQTGKDFDRERVQYAARIVDGAGCVWGNPIGAVAFDGLLRSSEVLQLEEGLAKLRFESGAEVVLKGPAELFVDSGMRCRLSEGELTADVPSIARGFTVQTPLGRVVDLGTAFGVKVGDEVELQVFEGEIEVYPGKDGTLPTASNTNARQDAPVELTSGSSRKLQINDESSNVRLVDLVGADHPFTRVLPDEGDLTAKKPTVLAVDSFVQGGFGARLLERDGGFGWSSAWTDEGVDSNSVSFAVGPNGVTSRGSGDGAAHRHLAEEFTTLRTIFFSAEFRIDGPDEVCSAWLELFKFDKDRWSNGELDLVTIGITDRQFSGRMAPWKTAAVEKELGDCGEYEPGTRHLVIGKLEFNAVGKDERLSVWVDPLLADEPYPDRIIMKDTGWEHADAVAIRCWEMDDATSATIDEVRVGKTWVSVVQ